MLENNLPDGGTKQNLQIYRVSPSCCLQYICGIFFLDTIFQCQQFVLKYAVTYSQTIFLVDPCEDNVWYMLTFQFVQFQLHLLLLFHNHYLPNFSSIEVKKNVYFSFNWTKHNWLSKMPLSLTTWLFYEVLNSKTNIDLLYAFPSGKYYIYLSIISYHEGKFYHFFFNFSSSDFKFDGSSLVFFW